MKKLAIVSLIIILVIIAIAFLIFSNQRNISGAVISNKYSFTKAICNETNFCQDYLIYCEGNKTTEIKPVTGAAVQLSQNWIDVRENKTKLCG